MTECKIKSLEFKELNHRDVVADFNGGTITSDGGALLLREVEERRGVLKRFSDCFRDYRDPKKIEHAVFELVSQRTYGIILGYEDLIDHDDLRRDVLLSVLVGKEDPTGQSRIRKRDRGCALAGKSTLNRLELTPENSSKDSRYKKIVYESEQIDLLLVDIFLESYHKPPKEIILDVDPTDDPLYGKQEGRFFHGYYGHYCYLPLYIFCGDHLLCARLRPSNIDASAGTVDELERIVSQIRKHWQDVRIIVRGDSSFAREEIMSWCEGNDVDYIFGLAKNPRLIRRIENQLEHSRREYLQTGNPARCFRSFSYRTLKSWNRKRRVVGKAEYLEKGANPRFVVTSISGNEINARVLYEDRYCARGEMENRIKEQQLYLFADRTSTRVMRANQLRLLFSSIAYVLYSMFRRVGLQGTQFARAQCHTIRNKLFKIGAIIKISVRRIYVQFATGYPYSNELTIIMKNIRNRFQPLRI